MTSDYKQQLDALLEGLEAAVHDDDQVELWVEFFVREGYSPDEAFEVVAEGTKQRRGKKGAEVFAGRIRSKLMWQKP